MTGNVSAKKVLVVDDEPDTLELVKLVLESAGFKTMLATSGRDALKLAQESKPDLVLLDIMMPDMDGYDTMRAIRKLARFRTLPVIALTAKAMKGDREKCLEAGASDYITKPVSMEQLTAMMRLWITPGRAAS